MKDNYPKAYQEVYEVISLLPETLVKLIPLKFMKLIEEKRDRNYNINLKTIDDVETYDFMDETVVMLGMIYSYINAKKKI